MFKFKQFTVRQDHCAMKVGTDGVLLGAWASVCPDDRRILDIGTGTGLIALMLAQRAPLARITGIDIEDVAQARENAAASSWAERLDFAQISAQNFAPAEPFDLILSNPPFFTASLLPPDAGRTTARHTVALPLEALRDAVVRLLAPAGRFALILPAEQMQHFRILCAGKLDLVRLTDVRTTPRRAPKRTLAEFVRTTAEMPAVKRDELIIGTGEHEQYTAEYRALTRDFYLKF